MDEKKKVQRDMMDGHAIMFKTRDRHATMFKTRETEPKDRVSWRSPLL